MQNVEAIHLPDNAQQILISAVAHHIERMSKDELQTLVAKAQADFQNENSALQQCIKYLEEENAKLVAQVERLMYRISRTLFNEGDYENFDPTEFTTPWEEVLANARKRLKKS